MTNKKNFIRNLGLATLLLLGTAQVTLANSLNSEATLYSETTKPATSWITTRVPYDISAKELAHNYYGDANDYQLIVDANKGKIGKNLMFRKGTEVVIPVTEKFRDLPEVIGWN